MKNITGISLPHLTENIVKNARKTRLDAFAVALEGWRRGLKLKWYTKDSPHFDNMIIFGVNPPGRLFSLSSDNSTHYFFRTRGDKVTNKAVEIGSEKGDTKEILQKNGIPVPEGQGFDENATDEEIIEFSKSLDYPLVFKPTNASLGNGVVTNIRNEKELIEAINYVRHELTYKEVIIEQYVTGKEYRLYVIENQVVAVYNRIPANITGDGEHTIAELIDLKNYDRRKNSRLNSCLIIPDKEIEEFITEQGYTYESIPAKGKYIRLREKTNVSSGGDPIEVTDEVSDSVKQIAIDAVKAIPGLYHAGVDIIKNDDQNRSVVLEINPTAQIGGALFPLKGESKDIPKAIIDYYFPETKGIDTSSSKIYFDMTTVLEPLEDRTALEVEVAPAPMGKLYIKKYIVTGDVQRHIYHNWLKKQAIDRGLNGYVKNMVFDEIEIVVASTDKAEVDNFKNVIKEYPQGSNVGKIIEENWDEPVTVGFEITERYNTSTLRAAQYSLRRMNQDLAGLIKQKNRIEKDISHIENSTSWKVSKPLRTVGQVVKRK